MKIVSACFLFFAGISWVIIGIKSTTHDATDLPIVMVGLGLTNIFLGVDQISWRLKHRN